MVEVRWTPQAADDLEAITEFISQDSLHYARLFAAVERLSAFPELGRIVPEKLDLPTCKSGWRSNLCFWKLRLDAQK